MSAPKRTKPAGTLLPDAAPPKLDDSRRVFGVDEAGRGPIIGPMAIAVVALDKRGAAALRRAGVADSKSFGFGADACAKRAALAEKVRTRAIAWGLRLVEVEEIDMYTRRGQLNALERRVACEILRELACATDERIVCDGALLFSPLRALFPSLRAVDNGESAHVSVAAASIVAKDARDVAFAKIAKRYEPEFGPITGGGYINAATRRFLDAYRARHNDLPPEARRSWGAPKLEDTLPLFDPGKPPRSDDDLPQLD